jgi:endonuclease/exonuclease/phosphatase family metal-dependent hydrolase
MYTRLVSYNIMSGGEGRADPIAEVLLGQHADVIGLHETTDTDVLHRLAQRLKMAFVVADSDGGSVALFTRHPILDSLNVGLLHRSSLPLLDAFVRLANGQAQQIRVAHLTQQGEADRMAQRLQHTTPAVMLMSHDPPIGRRVVDAQVVPAARPVPERTHAPVRQLDHVVVRSDVKVVRHWIEQDRLAYYASDHLPAGVEVDFT